MKELTEAGAVHCANCNTPMQGEFCHHCGQSIHSVLKPMHHMAEDAMDMVLHVDGRIVHTLPPLLLKPGFLTLEYFSGRRQRYVAPFRLMFVLCLLTFFAFHLAVDRIAANSEALAHPDVIVDSHVFDQDDSPADVREHLKDQLDGLAESRRVPGLPSAALQKIDQAGELLRQQANRRLLALGAAPIPAASPALPAAPASTSPWNGADKAPAEANDETTHTPIHIAWLPGFVNARLTLLLERFRTNWHAFKQGDAAARHEAEERMINGVFGVLPQAMVVMIPLFAGLLKLFYLFRRRLYMEHIIVALHSHAFLFLSLLLVALAGMLSSWLKPYAAWTGQVFGLAQAVVLIWMPAYLLVMQKRIYRQGWLMTLTKYWCIGWSYLWLLFMVLLIAVVLGIAH